MLIRVFTLDGTEFRQSVVGLFHRNDYKKQAIKLLQQDGLLPIEQGERLILIPGSAIHYIEIVPEAGDDQDAVPANLET